MPDIENKKEESKGLLITKVVFNVLFYLILIFIFICSIANIRSGSKVDTMPNIFGRGYLTVATDSMSGSQSNSFNAGDMIVVNVIENNKQEVANNLHVGDIITFYDEYNLKGLKKQLNSHRVVFINDNNGDGNVDSIYLMGDYIAEQRGIDSSTDFIKLYEAEGLSTVQRITPDEIRGTYIKTIKNGGNVSNTISQWGLLIVVLPLVIFLIVQVFIFIKNLKDYKNAKYQETHKDEIEAKEKEEREKLKAELKAQLLAEMKAEENNVKNESDSSSNDNDSKEE